MAYNKANRNRPLSPHLQIYKPQITSVLSITHRATGVFLSFGGILFSYWLISATYGSDAFDTAQSVLRSWLGQLILMGLTFSIFYHLGNGIRHLAWDMGWGFERYQIRLTAWLTIFFALVMTAVTLGYLYMNRGGA